MIDIQQYLHYYLGQKVIVKVNYPGNEELTGTICEVTRNSNHGDWIKVHFDWCRKVYRPHYNWDGANSNMHTFFLCEDMIKPIVRRLESITEEECQAGQWGSKIRFMEFVNYHKHHDLNRWFACDFHYLLSRGFWIFGDEAFEQGLIIDAATLNKESKA